ncbi:binary toxin-like calcium binding domain-containing protein [Brevibacillus laterosporus]|uniref:PA14 domain-containing protein n=7 Tax=Brevibacillus laterosporus TaxID=1465 RepID=A0AAP3GBE5_BRELA|nr:binary toxin-like calcium binding domain-containing protein [Brevibacillus laterosporus]MCR8980777.1 PA14 domain-containing protein [Brevibacillus laterosporus]MCZ0807932.1 PA14 domain-containing protein [Brevibacillus laterosporus]MCZ0826177.1 PA14 domain-containing protein [Brevibacillus laterosporus]
MKLPKMYTCLLATALLGQFATYPELSHAASSEREIINDQDANFKGLLGYYFTDKELKETALISNSESGDLSVDNDQIDDMLPDELKQFQSAMWTGFVKAGKSGEYTFSTSDNDHTILWIDDQQVIDQSSSTQKIYLEKGKLYKVKITYKPESPTDNEFGLQLKWITPAGKEEIIPEGNLLLPDIKNQPENESSRKKRSISATSDDGVEDSDGDGIPDSLEIEGYTLDIKNKKLTLMPWIEKVHGKKVTRFGEPLTKYTSSPSKWSTASDPYSDFAKVSGIIDKKVKVRHPLLAAYPNLQVHMDKFIISKNRNETLENGGNTSSTISGSTSTSNTHSTEVSVGAEVNVSLFNFGGSVSTNFSDSNSQTVTIDHSSSESLGRNWSKSIGLNAGEAAYFNANIRYVNNGTAPIYEAAPTTSLVLGKNDTIATIKAKENQLANVVLPDRFYPSKDQAAISLQTKDDFGSSPITINKDQLDILEQTKQMRLETDQVSGYVGVIDPKTKLVEVDKDKQWSHIIPQIEETSARLILKTPDDLEIERRVAAIDPIDFIEQTKPDVTLGEALKLAFGFEDKNGTLSYKNTSIDNFKLVFDEETAANIEKQLENMETESIYDVQLHARMNILISPKKDEPTVDVEVSDWETIDGEKYYYRFGEMQTGWQTIDGKKYYFNKNGVLEPSRVIEDGTYQIKTALKNNSLVDWNRSDNNITLYEKHNGSNQKWKLEYNDTHQAYVIRNLEDNNKIMAWNAYQNLTNVFATPFEGKEEHFWIPESLGNGFYKLKNKKDPTKVLDVDGSGTSNGSNIQVSNYKGADNQKWELEKLEAN